MGQINFTMSLIYAAVSAGMLFWAWKHLESRREERRRMERVQQIIVVLHFLVVGGWFLRHQIGFVVRESDLTTAGTVYESLGVISALGIAAASILINPGVRWNRFFVTFGIVALVHASTFGVVALRWGSSLGLVPGLEEIISDKELFGMEETGEQQAAKEQK
jgi:hypothetical protein